MRWVLPPLTPHHPPPPNIPTPLYTQRYPPPPSHSPPHTLIIWSFKESKGSTVNKWGTRVQVRRCCLCMSPFEDHLRLGIWWRAWMHHFCSHKYSFCHQFLQKELLPNIHHLRLSARSVYLVLESVREEVFLITFSIFGLLLCQTCNRGKILIFGLI